MSVMAKNAGTTFVLVLTLGLGIGVNTAIFGVVNAFLLRPLAVTNPKQIAILAFHEGTGPLKGLFSIPD
jgi:hypothetical protein